MKCLICDMASRAERFMTLLSKVIGLNHLTLQGQHHG